VHSIKRPRRREPMLLRGRGRGGFGKVGAEYGFCESKMYRVIVRAEGLSQVSSDDPRIEKVFAGS
jgi:hypothetical protein